MNIILNPVITSITDENTLLDYQVNSTTGLVDKDVIIIQTKDSLKNILAYLSLDDKITGDIEFFNVVKDFRYSHNNYSYSDWIPFNLTNLKVFIEFDVDLYLEFRYSVIRETQNYNFNTVIDKPTTNGWFKLSSNNSYFKIPKSLPINGDITYTIGFGTNGQYHVNDTNNNIYFKNNGVWSTGTKFERNATTSGITYIPQMFNNVIMSDSLINMASHNNFIPTNDYVLTTDIKFVSSDNIQHIVPEKNDFVYINPLLQGLTLNGVESLYVKYEYPINPSPKIYLKNIYLNVNKFIGVNNGEMFCLYSVGDSVVFKPDMTLKMFNITDVSVEVNGICSSSWNSCLLIEYRYSFNSRNWDSVWTPLTPTNLKCIKGTPLKFFYIEFRFTKICETGYPFCVSDVTINGDFQNISNNYQQLNRFGLRSDCDYGSSSGAYNPITGDCTIPTTCSPNIIPLNWATDTNTCATDKSLLYNPYDMNQSLQLYDKLANDNSDMFGHTIDYYKTMANDSGIDTFLHEYGTYDTVDKQKIKVLVPDNKFPEDVIGINMGDMGLFDTFEIHITKKEFYRAFGIGNRPAQKDYLFFCQINKWFEVEHAQSYREYNNASIYYKVMLIKKENNREVDNKQFIDFADMTKNNALDNLFGQEVFDNAKKVVNDFNLENPTEKIFPDVHEVYDNNVIIDMATNNKEIKEILDITKPDPKNIAIYVPSIDYDLENHVNVIARNYYDMSSRTNQLALQYHSVDNDICDCCNRAITIWFNIQQYVVGQEYNIISNYNSITNKGYQVNFVDGRMEVVWFGQVFDIDVLVAEKKWYGMVINFNQNQQKLELYLYRRQSENGCFSTELQLINEESFTLTPVSYKNGDLDMKVNGSQMLWTNLRIYKEIIPKSTTQLVLNQYVIKNMDLVVLSENCSKIVNSDNHKF